MIRIFHGTSFDFIKWWRVAAGVTIAFIVLGLATFAITGGVNYSIEFTSGTLVQLRFTNPPNAADIRATLDGAGIRDAEIQQFGSPTEWTVRARGTAATAGTAADDASRRIEAALSQRYGRGVSFVRTEVVGPKVGRELTAGAAWALLWGAVITLIYLAIRFEWRFGVAAVLSSVHDILVTLAFIKLTHLEVSLTIVAAILTLLGYSMNDTIIIFDRVRENMKRGRKEELYALLNRSINETLPRSVLTHVTVLAATIALLLFAGEVIRPFAWVMTFGVFVATFSSIYVASPLLLWIETRYPRETEATKSRSGTRPQPSRPERSRPRENQPAGAR